MSTFMLPTHVNFLRLYPQVVQKTNFVLNFSWLRVQMSYHRFKNLAGLLHGDLTAKIRQGILSKDLMDR